MRHDASCSNCNIVSDSYISNNTHIRTDINIIPYGSTSVTICPN